MNLENFLNIYATHPHLKSFEDWFAKNEDKNILIKGLQASSPALVTAAFYTKVKTPILVVIDENEAAANFYNDLTQLLGDKAAAFLPSAYRHSPADAKKDTANEILRTDALNRMSSGKPFLVVASPDGLAEKVVSQNSFSSQKIRIKQGDKIDTEDLESKLLKYGFEPVDFVYEPGQFSQRGSIFDIFSFTNELPYRIDFFGNDVESIRTFDIEKQLSKDACKELSIVPNIDEKSNADTISILDFVPDNTLIFINNFTFITDKVNQIYDDTLVKMNSETKMADVKHLLATGDELKTKFKDFRTVEFGSRSHLSAKTTLTFNQSAQPLFHKNFDLVANDLKQHINEGYNIYICSDNKKQTDRIRDIFADRGDHISFTEVEKTFHEGFIDHDLSLCCYTDHQIFDRYHRYALQSDVARAGKLALTLKELNELQVGDYVVHIDHGIGKFGGLVQLNNDGKKQEAIKLIYRDDDIIFVSIHGLHRISKYKGQDGTPPTLNKIGTGAWQRLKERTKSKVKDIARDLIQLYAKRKEEKGFEYSPDSYLQHELEASFIYEDTPDQTKVTADIKQDMESAMPMDRLVCGDVGFGKTEIAIRAAFKAVTDSKQVAVLVPTTVLALQHYDTFKERLKDFPCHVEYLSRAKSSAETHAILDKLKKGEIDILIGTHKLVGKSVVFRDLGLLIIDEEQKFGVSIKEKLKQLKVNVDTLTLTATPIPRTMQFSLMGARDLSILQTPPANRYPVYTELHTFDDEIVKQAITREMNRNGQVFFINNRVQNIYLIEQKLRALVPEARIAIAHGQMPSKHLETVILDFINYEYDVLIATSVVESGVDIPNVNTIIVNNAQMFGLSDLHQLRGRVGRSNKKAFCYLMTPPVKQLTDDARRRLQAIETFSELGSGFNIAMQDLDIRGAGNILGAEQSGFITDLGYETYQKILNEALTELRDNEFANVFADKTDKKDYTTDCQIDSDLQLMFPNWYVESDAERISLYRELDNITKEADLLAYESRLVDRFGEIPPEARDLMTMVRLRWLGQQYGVERMTLKRGQMRLHLIVNTESPFYNSEAFGKLLDYITNHVRECTFKPGDQANNKPNPLITIKNIFSVDQAYATLRFIENIAIN